MRRPAAGLPSIDRDETDITLADPSGGATMSLPRGIPAHPCHSASRQTCEEMNR